MRENAPKLAIERLSWQEARNVFSVEPELQTIIDELSPDYPIFKATYPFGSIIFHKGVFFLPASNGNTIPINDPSIPSPIKEQLGYNTLPLGLLPGTAGTEVYSELEDRVFSIGYFEQGLHLGIWEALAPPTPFTISAGARSLHMLPKITDAAGHKRLRQIYNVTSPPPNTPFDQWSIMKQIANQKSFEQSWHCDVYFFSNEWMKQIKSKTNKNWLAFFNFVLERAWAHTAYGRNKVMLDTLWESFSRQLAKERIKPNSHIIDLLKHLVFAAMGVIPTFSPATTNKPAPIDGLLSAYLDVYELKNYTPSLMQPHHFSIEADNDFGYCSLLVPTYIETTPKYRNSNSARIDLAELIELMDYFVRLLLNCEHQSGGIGDIQELLRHIQFDYFHSDANESIKIRPSSSMPEEDPDLLYMPLKYSHHPHRKFCEKSSFTRGCIRISKK